MTRLLCWPSLHAQHSQNPSTDGMERFDQHPWVLTILPPFHTCLFDFEKTIIDYCNLEHENVFSCFFAVFASHKIAYHRFYCGLFNEKMWFISLVLHLCIFSASDTMITRDMVNYHWFCCSLHSSMDKVLFSLVIFEKLCLCCTSEWHTLSLLWCCTVFWVGWIYSRWSGGICILMIQAFSFIRLLD